jgi:hypothetical protein
MRGATTRALIAIRLLAVAAAATCFSADVLAEALPQRLTPDKCVNVSKRHVRASELRDAMNGDDPDLLSSVLFRVACNPANRKAELEEPYNKVTPWSDVLPKAEAEKKLRRYFLEFDRTQLWWEQNLRPQDSPAPLRSVAEFIRAMVLVDTYLPDGLRDPLVRARRAGDYLLRAQAEAGAGLFPFPAWRGNSTDRMHRLSERFLSQAERQGRLGEVTRNGWVFSDFQEGGLQFDNGLAGEALIRLYERTGDKRYLAGAEKAAKWTLAQPLSHNFNYNGFAALLLANVSRVTGNKTDLEAALHISKRGAISGQWQGGDDAGNWIDPHNKRLNYRYLMMRQLLAVHEAASQSGTPDADIANSLALGLASLERQQRENGGLGNIYSASEAYCDLYLRHRDEKTFSNWPSDTARMTITAGLDQTGSDRLQSPTVVVCSLILASGGDVPDVDDTR